MLEYFKIILSKVSFSKYLFEKELRKTIKILIEAELEELQRWCYRKFGDIYQSIIQRCFMSSGLTSA